MCAPAQDHKAEWKGVMSTPLINASTRVCAPNTPVAQAANRLGLPKPACVHDSDCGGCGRDENGWPQQMCIDDHDMNPGEPGVRQVCTWLSDLLTVCFCEGLYPSPDVDDSRYKLGPDGTMDSDDWARHKLSADEAICRMGFYIDGIAARQADVTTEWLNNVSMEQKFCDRDSVQMKVCDACTTHADCAWTMNGVTINGTCSNMMRGEGCDVSC